MTVAYRLMTRVMTTVISATEALATSTPVMMLQSTDLGTPSGSATMVRMAVRQRHSLEIQGQHSVEYESGQHELDQQLA